jgi:Brp/Blh family beta-carotene 15,15'-monooxygenase|tara:strand:- start:334 stop:1197 length:864 start_codon:yes stop_codon:yes gene_type:complete
MDVVVKSKLAGLILAFSIIFFGLESSYSILLFLVVMLSIGIPHGSVDHLIAFINPNARKFESKFIFYITYLSLIIFNIILWVISPFLGLLVFLIISCYHFGETQVIGYNPTDNKILNFVIGANILLSLFLNNILELQEILYIIPQFATLDLSSFDSVFFLLLSVVILMLSIVNFDIKRKVPLYAEITILYMVFFHTDLLTSFALYFGFCHSLPMLMLEFKEFKTENFIKFYLKTLPFTILSIFFGFLLYQFNNDLLTSDNLILFVFIVISSLTLPHVFIMKDFVKDK